MMIKGERALTVASVVLVAACGIGVWAVWPNPTPPTAAERQAQDEVLADKADAAVAWGRSEGTLLQQVLVGQGVPPGYAVPTSAQCERRWSEVTQGQQRTDGEHIAFVGACSDVPPLVGGQ